MTLRHRQIVSFLNACTQAPLSVTTEELPVRKRLYRGQASGLFLLNRFYRFW
jgi:hypothetical protein